MKIDKHTVASVTYTLEVDGDLVEKTDQSNPLTFLVGVGMMIPGFEQQLLGKQAGDTYTITVQPEEGYGDPDPQAIVDLPKDVFKIEGELQEDMLVEGNIIPMQDQNGNPLQGVILEVKEDTVKLDFNHMLAGKTLNFSGEVLEVRKATQEEISHGHVHGPGGHHH
ncbi:FKBP-type peptidyl-prolyl cis-trans isomerase [Cesiribacter andamanensis]|uniref:Peptidyl-prolyl cis-trans isomerase n=1 Tax=Cesiribacter andamanensis AMV16 TaxID=1279009 RepID=M7NBX2_9BACT|nr:peptidylprolyl isomerase [Cesiribacter andamanensis]EMR04737.1 FKBP-type peptidyl-prolyl cis-trans isomerase slyD [Cesiribacter andamanensis AMV16]